MLWARPLPRWWPWAVGAGTGVVVLGPALGPGSLLNLDLLALPRIQVPAGIWGLGPELPRRVPYGTVLAWCSRVLGGPATVKVLILGAVVAAVAGAARLVRDAPPVAQLGAGLTYGLSPFVLTRIGVGHLAVVLAVAVLPWALPTLLRPADHIPRTFLWAAALGVAGVSGGTLALVCVTVGVAAERGRRLRAVLGAVLLAQLPWVVPGVVVAAGGVRLNPAGGFATRAGGLVGVLGLPAGHGFWRASSQVGGDASKGAALLGAVLLVLALAGMRRLPQAWAGRATALGAVGAGLALASAVPGVRDGYEALTRTAVFGAGRESQRWLSLFLVWLAPAAALGAVRLGGSVIRAVPTACAVALAVPGLWGVGGRLEPVDIPPGWHAADVRIDARPGPVLALPWHQYLDVRAAQGRRVLNPLPDYLGGDVLSSSNPELSLGRQEEADPRERHVPPVLDRIAAGRPVADRLAALGVRWVVLLHEVDWRRMSPLRTESGLRRVYADADVELFEVQAWRGPIVTATGAAIASRPVVAPLARPPASPPATWQRAAAPGWMRGLRRVGATPVGTLELPGGGGTIWFWPALLVLLAYLCTLCVALRAWRACKLKEPSVPSD